MGDTVLNHSCRARRFRIWASAIDRVLRFGRGRTSRTRFHRSPDNTSSADSPRQLFAGDIWPVYAFRLCARRTDQSVHHSAPHSAGATAVVSSISSINSPYPITRDCPEFQWRNAHRIRRSLRLRRSRLAVAGSSKDRSVDRPGAGFRFPNSDVEKRGPRRLAGGPGSWDDLHGYTGRTDRVHCPKPGVLRLHGAISRAT